MDNKLSKARSEVSIAKVDRKYCYGVDYKHARKAYVRALRRFNKTLCREAN